MDNQTNTSTHKYAVVTGANKGIGLAIVQQLAIEGITVVLTARNEESGTEAALTLTKSGLPNIVFHQLDVQDSASVETLAGFVNNAGASGVEVDAEGLKSLNIDSATWLSGNATNMVQGLMRQTYEKAKECIDTNYYGCVRVTEALLPLLQLSISGARIVIVSSLRSELKRIPNEQIRKSLGDLDTLSLEKLDEMLQTFLRDLKEGVLVANGWPTMVPAYSISKATVNAYTRIVAKKYKEMCINCVHPGFVATDLNLHTGTMTVDEGARSPVLLALLPDGSPSGCYFDQTQMAEF
ncbi:hypothetical protein IFM89_003166 [Coptis chinensis]|uniref:Uncharacterized protein n=1 Tax=Coptis chinensis TaxID=261450 RepID=A0A835I7J0_9MAGN|nr:hypothetical protein IFM89_003166 [Coptis chinensis]